ncbi:MAG: sugar transferase [Candidatus Endonucleobacter bathymodioli]|uniref:Sugar transferase n=1 Tax=Candidatus Endonucleibacter bathymodioli TaxID=539814 RepID=A0AA90P316_9GAMM|nr:sugar transferase [Candidatus Endonucleobacter bathymodioli]
MNAPAIRCLDFLLAILGLVVALPILLFVFILGLLDTGSPMFLQQRVGRNKRSFVLIKFRTMAISTASMATHQVDSSAVTSLGAVLRKTKFDELPQLINVLKGEMSIVGPRPCLHTQEELIDARDNRGVFSVLPGITGLAQVNEIDMSTPELLAEWDQRMIAEFSMAAYSRYIMLTVMGRGAGDRVKPKDD